MSKRKVPRFEIRQTVCPDGTVWIVEDLHGDSLSQPRQGSPSPRYIGGFFDTEEAAQAHVDEIIAAEEAKEAAE